MSVHEKLASVRVALHASKIKRSGVNAFAKYKYFDLADFLPTVNEMFLKSSLCGVLSYGPTMATLTITDFEDKSSIEITCPMSTAALKGCHEVQNLGAVLSYIRRYLWITALEIVEHDALDATTNPDEPIITPMTDKEKLDSLRRWGADLNVNKDKMLAFLTDKAGFLVTRFADCPPSLYPVIEDYLTNYKEEMQ